MNPRYDACGPDLKQLVVCGTTAPPGGETVEDSVIKPVISDIPVSPRARWRWRPALSDRSVRNAGVLGATAGLLVLSIIVVLSRRSLTNIAYDTRTNGLLIALAVGVPTVLALCAGMLLQRRFPRTALLGAAISAPAFIYASGALSLTTSSLRDEPWRWLLYQIVLWTPFMLVLTLAAVSAIPRLLMESIAVDRIGVWFSLRTLVIPLIAPAIVLGVLFRIIDSFRITSPPPVQSLHAHFVALKWPIFAYGVLGVGILAGVIAARWIDRARWRRAPETH